MRVLVVYGSKMGGTQGLAEMVGDELAANGLETDVKAAKAVRNIHPYAAVIVGGALYSLRWHKDARRFVRRHRAALQEVPVWLFSSGPLDESAVESDIPPVHFVRKTIERVGTRGHVTFGGRLAADATGFPAASMAKESAGDWRDPDHVRVWAKTVAEEIFGN